MRVEIPELQRCCCCLPLRRGLLFWVYLKLVFGVLAVLYLTNSFLVDVPIDHLKFYCATAIIGVVVFVIDVIFCLLFIISAHRKKHEHMRLYYRYATVMLIIGVLALLGVIGTEIYIGVVFTPKAILFVHYMFQFTCFIFVNLVLHAYLVLLVRSEALKLEKDAQFQFSNHNNEPVCKAQIVT